MPMPSKAVPLSFVSSPGSPPRDHQGRKQPARVTSPPIAARSRVRETGRRCIVMVRPASPLAVHLGLEDPHEAKVAVQLAVVEPVPDDELVRDREAPVIDVDLDEPAGRL